MENQLPGDGVVSSQAEESEITQSSAISGNGHNLQGCRNNKRNADAAAIQKELAPHLWGEKGSWRQTRA